MGWGAKPLATGAWRKTSCASRTPSKRATATKSGWRARGSSSGRRAQVCLLKASSRDRAARHERERPDITWSEAAFKDYIKDPKARMPGTKMLFPGSKRTGGRRPLGSPQAVQDGRQQETMTNALTILSALIGVVMVSATGAQAQSSDALPLRLEAKIPLGNVKGRLDHFALDPHRHRLFLAELENDTVGVIDLNRGQTIHTIRGLREPQGLAYVAAGDALYVANGGDGSLRLFRAE